MEGDADRRVNEGLALPFSGWDFSPIATRRREGTPPWDYAALLRERIRPDTTLVDLGTGGGEFLASLAPLPRNSFATEGYPPNLPVAQRRLAPLGVRVLPVGADLRIPLPDRSVDLVADRHEAFSAPEVFRVLRPGGWFLTQQVGSENHRELLEELGPPETSADGAHRDPPTNRVGNVTELADEIATSGLEVRDRREAMYSTEFLDVGAVAFYLRAIPWEVPEFSLERYRAPLHRIDREIQRTGSFRVTDHRLLVVAQRPE